jgi:ABC-2 type transport system permease protein
VMLTALFNLGLNMVVVFVFLLGFGVSPAWTWLLLPVVIAILFVITTAVAMIVSSLYPRFRDTAIIWGVLVTALFYATPVLYPLEVVPEALRKVMMLNPLASLFELARGWIIDPGAPGPADLAGSSLYLLAPLTILVLVCLFAVWIFRREAPRIAEEL